MDAPFHRATLHRQEARLWALAFCGAFVTGLLLAVASALLLATGVFPIARAAPVPAAELEPIVTISSEMFELEPAAEPPEIPTPETPPVPPVEKTRPEKSRFANTAPEDSGKRPDQPAYFGERNSTAAGDAPPDPAAPFRPAQTGAAAAPDTAPETTSSTFQETGEITPAQTLPQKNLPTTPAETSGRLRTGNLLDGPTPLEIHQLQPPAEKLPEPSATSAANPPEKSPIGKPASHSETPHRMKTAVNGSMSRGAQSALDVADTPLGRYQAEINRAVEREWQRNCVRHKSFITPGLLTVRFLVSSSGKVTSVEFVGDIQAGSVQKGFTLDSIRNAPLPPMPAAIRRDYRSQPLELVFNFYF